MVLIMAGAALGQAQPRAQAAMEPSFVVTCYPTGIAKNDPIVFPGQSGASHMHTFFGAKGVTASTTASTLSQATSSQCGSYYDGIDLSAYWIPTLYKNGQQVYRDDGSIQLRSYYQRAGGAGGEPVVQAWPRGLKIIAGDMHATSAQPEVYYFCANTVDTGNQSKGSTVFPSCASNETLVAKLTFPDCWDGKYLDSADHKSHMEYSSGSRNTCPSDHPVKLAQLTFEAWFYGVNGSGSDFSWASGGPYSFHGDVMSMWQPRPAANLVNQCINVAFDCNPLIYPNVPVGAVTQAQIDAQYTGQEPPASTPTPSPTMTMPPTPSATPTASPTPTHDHSTMPTPTASATATPTMSSTASATPTATATPTHDHSAMPTPSASASPSASPTPTMTMKPTVSPTPSATPTATRTPTTSPTLGTLTSDVPRFKAVGDSILKVGVNEGNWGPGQVTFRYQWLRNGSPIAGETASTYDFTRADQGNYVSVQVTGSKAGYASVTRTSKLIGPIWFPSWAQPSSRMKMV